MWIYPLRREKLGQWEHVLYLYYLVLVGWKKVSPGTKFFPSFRYFLLPVGPKEDLDISWVR